jgi:hypothetical protein
VVCLGDSLHDIIADSNSNRDKWRCHCDEDGQCALCRLDELAHSLSPTCGDEECLTEAVRRGE